MKQLRLRTIFVAAPILALVCGVAVLAVPVQHWLRTERDADAAKPIPRRATAEEFAAITAVLLPPLTYMPHDPPPPPGGPEIPIQPRLILVSSSSACLQPGPGPGCRDDFPGMILDVGLEEVAPQKLRAELVAANPGNRSLRFPSLPQILVVDSSEIHNFHARLEPSQSRHPEALGTAEISVPVLSLDRRHALVYLRFRGSGNLYYMERTKASWRVMRKETLWVS